jgi:hypothetical protein
MANIQLPNDVVRRYTIHANDVAGDPVALPPGRTPTLVNSAPTELHAVIDTDGVSLLVNALVNTATGISVEIDDGTLTPFTMVFDIVEDLAPTSVVVDLTKFTDTAQPRPSAAPVAPATAAPATAAPSPVLGDPTISPTPATPAVTGAPGDHPVTPVAPSTTP